MTKKEFIDNLAARHDITKREATEWYDGVFDYLIEAVESGEEVAIPGLGKFSFIVRNERECHNPRTGEKVISAAHYIPKFKFSSTVKEAVKQFEA